MFAGEANQRASKGRQLNNIENAFFHRNDDERNESNVLNLYAFSQWCIGRCNSINYPIDLFGILTDTMQRKLHNQPIIE